MRTVSTKYTVLALILFIIFSTAIYLLNFPPFAFPHIPMFVIFICSEKNIKKKLIILIAGMLLYSQMATPLPFIFLFIISLQIYIAAHSVFNVSVFDYSLSALISGIFIQLILNLNTMLYIIVFTGKLQIYSTLIYTVFSSGILLFIYLFLKPHIDKIFIKDTWL